MVVTPRSFQFQLDGSDIISFSKSTFQNVSSTQELKQIMYKMWIFFFQSPRLMLIKYWPRIEFSFPQKKIEELCIWSILIWPIWIVLGKNKQMRNLYKILLLDIWLIINISILHKLLLILLVSSWCQYNSSVHRCKVFFGSTNNVSDYWMWSRHC